jgi:cell division protein FtsB
METLAVFRDISLLWLIFLTFLAVLPFGVLFFFAVKGMHRLRQLAKQYLPVAQDYARLVADKSEEVSQKVTDPIIGANAKAAQVNGLTKAIFDRRNNA